MQPQTGHLLVCVGGRGTRGAVYRIRWAKDVIDIADFGENLKYDPKTGKLIYQRPSPAEFEVKLAYHLDWKDELATELPKGVRYPSGRDTRIRALAVVITDENRSASARR